MTPAPQKPANLGARTRRFAGSLSIRSRVIGGIAGVLLVGLVAGGVAAAANPGAGRLADTSSASGAPTGAAAAAPASAAPAPTATASFTAESPADPASVTAASDAATVAITDTSGTNTLAATVLATLAVKGKAPKTGYDRVGDFGTAWLDVDRNGCDTRNDVLSRDLTNIVKSGTCKVMTGTIVSPYTSTTISFVRGAATSALVQIDHVVPLANAWQTGAQQLSQAQRVSLANDPLNLLAVDGRSNEQKSDGDTATWLPANKAYRCHYVARQISVKATYGLWVTQAERDAMSRILDTCPTEPALTSGFAPAPAAAVVAPAPAPAPAQEPEPAPVVAPAPVVQPAPAAPAAPAPAANVFYENCTAVRAAGAAPIHPGDPGWQQKFDRDKDGVGCE